MSARLMLAACIGMTAMATSPGAAAAEREHISREVTYGDLDLDHEAGAQVMLRRLSRAAATVCGDRSGPMPLAERRQIRACMASALERAVAELDAPMVTALYEDASPSNQSPARMAAR